MTEFALLVAVPTHDQTLSRETVTTLLGLQQRAIASRWTIEVRFYTGSVIGEIRNWMVRDLLLTSADAILMIDADQGCEPDMLMRMIAFARPVVGAVIPKRRLDWTKVAPGPFDPLRTIEQAQPYVGTLDLKPGGALEVVDGFARAVQVGAGVLLIRRGAVETLQARFPELRGKGGASAQSGEDDPFDWGFFNPLSDDRDQPLTEDFSFCRRWRDGCGGEIWAEVSTPIEHVGRFVHRGSLLDHLRALGETVDLGPIAEARAHLAAGRPSEGWAVLKGSAPLAAGDPDALILAEALASARGDWSAAAGICAKGVEADSEDLLWLARLQRALIRCGGIAEARDLACSTARQRPGPDRLALIAPLAHAYSDAGSPRRARLLRRWLARRSVQSLDLPLRLAPPGGDFIGRAVATWAGGEAGKVLTLVLDWLKTGESQTVDSLCAALLAETGRLAEAIAFCRKRLSDGRGTWPLLRSLVWTLGASGDVGGVRQALLDAPLAVSDLVELNAAYDVLRAAAAFGEERSAAAAIADGLDPVFPTAWLKPYFGLGAAPPRAEAAHRRLTAQVCTSPSPAVPAGAIHIVSPFAEAIGGSEHLAMDLARLLAPESPVRLWSLGAPHETYRQAGVTPIDPAVGRFPRGGSLIVVGAWFGLGPWLTRARPQRVVIVYNTFHAPRLEALIGEVVRHAGVKPELVFVADLMRREVDLPGSVTPPWIWTDTFPPTMSERPDASVVIGRHSRDSTDKHGFGDPAIYAALVAEGARVRLLGGLCLRPVVAPDPLLELLPAQVGVVPEFLSTLDIFYYRTGLWTEPCARCVMEAMAAGLPVVVDRRDGHSELITDGVEGFVVADDSQALERLRALITDPSLRQIMGAAARRRSETLFGPEAADRQRNVYLGRLVEADNHFRPPSSKA